VPANTCHHGACRKGGRGAISCAAEADKVIEATR
jgi:hypothetical protein